MDSWFTTFARWAINYTEPFVLLWLGLIALTLALCWRRQRGFAVAAGVATLYLSIISGTAIPMWLVQSLERPYSGRKVAALPTADVIVLLGGGVEPSRNEAARIHLTIAGDRLPMALELARLEKAPVLCVSGGHAKIGRYNWPEADIVAEAITERGLVHAEVISLGGSTDTHEEAQRLRLRARGWHRVLLVTSASHMRRAAAVFRAEGFEVIPAPCNFLSRFSNESRTPLFHMPSPYGFTLLSVWLHEQIGWLEYWRHGWLKE